MFKDFDTMEHSLQRLMWREQKRLEQLLQNEHDVTLPQFLVLVSIFRRGVGCPMGLLAGEMAQSNATMTGIVDGLVDKKLVVRENDPADRRRVVVNLTTKSRDLLERARAARRERLWRAFARFSTQDQRDFLRLLTDYLGELEKETP